MKRMNILTERRHITRTHILILFLFIAGFSVLALQGCEKEEEVDLTDWSLPHREDKVEITGDAFPEKNAEAEATPEPVTYTVRKGDVISGIAARHDISPRQLAEANGLALKGRGSVIYPGQKLIIPAK